MNKVYTSAGISGLSNLSLFIHKFVFPILSLLYLIFMIGAYITIFTIFVKSRWESSTQRESIFHMFVHSKFYIALLLAASFLLLTAIPIFAVAVVFFLFEQGVNISDDDIWLAALIGKLLPCLSDTIDGIIYAMLHVPVRNLLIVKIRTLHHKCVPKRFERSVEPELDDFNGSESFGPAVPSGNSVTTTVV